MRLYALEMHASNSSFVLLMASSFFNSFDPGIYFKYARVCSLIYPHFIHLYLTLCLRFINCFAIFKAADRVILSKPSGYNHTDAQYAQLMQNINITFGMNLPTSIGTYDYDKLTGTWKKVEIS